MNDSGIVSPKTKTGMDARQLRSRQGIRSAFIELLEDQPLDQISVRTIADRAGVGSSTFYRHYPGKEALLEDVAAHEIEKLVREVRLTYDQADTLAACIKLCEHIDAHRQAWTSLLIGGAAAVIRERLIQFGRGDLSRRPRREAGLPPELSSALVTGAMAELLGWWLAQWNPPSARAIAYILNEVVVLPVAKFRMSLDEIMQATGEGR